MKRCPRRRPGATVPSSTRPRQISWRPREPQSGESMIVDTVLTAIRQEEAFFALFQIDLLSHQKIVPHESALQLTPPVRHHGAPQLHTRVECPSNVVAANPAWCAPDGPAVHRSAMGAIGAATARALHIRPAFTVVRSALPLRAPLQAAAAGGGRPGREGCQPPPYIHYVATWQRSITSRRLPRFRTTLAALKSAPHQRNRGRLPPARLFMLAVFHNNAKAGGHCALPLSSGRAQPRPVQLATAASGTAAAGSPPVRRSAKYLASGWWTTIAAVVCSGLNW